MDCLHTQPLCDNREGMLVCLDCGFVIEEGGTGSESYEFSTTQEITSRYEEFIFDICANNHVSDSVRDCTVEFFRKTLLARKNKHNLNSLCAYALFHCLAKNQVYRSIFEIEQMTGVSSRKIWKLARNWPPISSVKPSYFLYLIEGRTEAVKRRDLIKLGHLDDFHFAKLFGSSYSPKGVLGGILYYDVNFKKRKKITFNCLSQLLTVSVSCLKRIFSKLKNELQLAV